MPLFPIKLPFSKKQRRRVVLAGVAMLLIAASFSFPTFWGPRLVGAILRSAIATPELGGTFASIPRVSLFSFQLEGLQFRAIPGTPTLDRLTAHYSPVSLLRHHRVNALDASGFRMDLAASIPPSAQPLFTNLWFEADLSIRPTEERPYGMIASLSGHALDWPLLGRSTFAITNLAPFALTASASLSLPETPWAAIGAFHASTNGWSASAELPSPVAFTETDPVLGPIATRALAPNPAVSNLVFSGAFSASVTASATPSRPVPAWAVQTSLTNGSLSLVASNTPIGMDGFRTRVLLSGLAEHWTLQPVWLSFQSGTVANWPLGRGYAHLLADEKSIMITRASTEFCKGSVQLYAFSFRPESLSTGFTLFLEDIDTGAFLTQLPAFHGTASGRLNGKIPIFLRNGLELRLRNAFLYSPPGETGTLHLNDPSIITDQLIASGIPASTCSNLDKALHNLDYTVLRLDLRPGTDDSEDALVLRLEGTATEKGKTVPVTLSVTFHGALEKLLNTGLRAINGPQKP